MLLWGPNRLRFSRRPMKRLRCFPLVRSSACSSQKAGTNVVRSLKYRAIAGRVTSRELDGKKFNRKSVEGAELCLDETVGVTVDKVKVKGSEIEASNGVIHDIDSVLIPPKA